MLLPPCWTLTSNSIENSSMLSNQHQPNFWFSNNPLPSFFSSGGGTDKNLYLQPPSSTNKILFDTNPCSSSSENSPPLSNDFLLTRSNPTGTLNLTQFNYIQQNHHHLPSSNNFLQRDDWSQIPTTSPNSTGWTKGNRIFLTSDTFMPSGGGGRLLNTSYIYTHSFYVLMVIR